MKRYETEFVLKVNELYHDVEAIEYKSRHDEIFVDEVARWQVIGEKFIAGSAAKIRLLDIGSGTGFVPLQIGGFLKEDATLICSDISATILNACMKEISSHKFKCCFEYVKLDGQKINLTSNSLDYITLNSVLHHIPNQATFFKEINRLLKTGGYLIIGHEPNRPFYSHRFLWNNYRYVSFVVYPRQFVLSILRRFGLTQIAAGLKPEVKTESKLVEGVNKRLLQEGIIKTPLSGSRLTEIVDIHSPTAGGYHKDKGIDISEIIKEQLPNFSIEYFDTYNHLCKVSSKNRFTKCYDSALRSGFPKTGATFMAVLRKVS